MKNDTSCNRYYIPGIKWVWVVCILMSTKVATIIGTFYDD